jgi:hypothetical protein
MAQLLSASRERPGLPPVPTSAYPPLPLLALLLAGRMREVAIGVEAAVGVVAILERDEALQVAATLPLSGRISPPAPCRSPCAAPAPLAAGIAARRR